MIRKEIEEWLKAQSMLVDELDNCLLNDLINYLEKREIAVLDQQPTILVDVPNGPPIDFVKNFKWKVYDNEDWENTSRSFSNFLSATSYAQSLFANSIGRIVVDFVNEWLFSFPKGTRIISDEIYKKMQSLEDMLIADSKNKKKTFPLERQKMFIDELKKQFTPDQVEEIQKKLKDAIIDYDKENGTYPGSVWEGASIYEFLTGNNMRKLSPNMPSYYVQYW